jgi:hypothetical protein
MKGRLQDDNVNFKYFNYKIDEIVDFYVLDFYSVDILFGIELIID